MIYAVGHISGAHFNPAVTFAFALTPSLPLAARGRLLGGAARRRPRRGRPPARLARQHRQRRCHAALRLATAQAFLWEMVLTFFLMFVIMAVATDTRAVGEAAAIAIGGTIGLDAMFGGPITGASMNPARSTRPGARLRQLPRALALHHWRRSSAPHSARLAYQFVRGEHAKRAADTTAAEAETV